MKKFPVKAAFTRRSSEIYVSMNLLRFQFQNAKNTLKNYQGRYQLAEERAHDTPVRAFGDLALWYIFTFSGYVIPRGTGTFVCGTFIWMINSFIIVITKH